MFSYILNITQSSNFAISKVKCLFFFFFFFFLIFIFENTFYLFKI